MFVRFVVRDRLHPESGYAHGVVGVAYDLLRSDSLDADAAIAIRERLTWLELNVPIPDRFNRSSSKGWYRRATRGLSWLRSDATDAIAAVRAIADALTAAGHDVVQIAEDRIGYVVYEDEQQVVAEPFRETRTH